MAPSPDRDGQLDCLDDSEFEVTTELTADAPTSDPDWRGRPQRWHTHVHPRVGTLPSSPPTSKSTSVPCSTCTPQATAEATPTPAPTGSH